ncbi:MAG: nuclear transport factor 2 family protein [Kiloniellaceae bacterium]
MIRHRISTAVGLLLLAGCAATQANASSAGDKAVAHFNAIGAGQVDTIIAGYTDATVFQWIGGPLDGEYRSKAAIVDLWRKFTGAQGKLDVQVSNVMENANPKGTTVTADVKFVGKTTIPVRYVLTYRGDDLVTEIWQIDPKLGQY